MSGYKRRSPGRNVDGSKAVLPVTRRPSRPGSFARRFATVAMLVLAAGLIAGLVVFGLLWKTLFAGMPVLPSRDALWSLNRAPAIEFLDASGETIAVRGPRYGRAIAARNLPPHVANAFIAAEDRRFRQHGGFDYRAVARAVTENARAGHTVQGGSTITQQLVKNLFLDNDQTLKRKAREASLATDLERALSKDEILDLYLNRIYFGRGCYGIDAAARGYFGKPPADLTLGEAAMLATLPKAPSRLSGQMSEGPSRARQAYVLDQMVAGGFVTPLQAQSARAEVLVYAAAQPSTQLGHVEDYAAAVVRKLLPRPPPDLVVKLSIDAGLQRRAQQAVANELAGLAPDIEAAVILADTSGAIRVMIGGRDYSKSQFNRATQAVRQPGSAFKVFVFAAALEAGLTPDTVRIDAPFETGGWRPRNYNDEYFGAVTLNDAFARSLNTVAARVGLEIGPTRVSALAHRFGISSPLHDYPSIALGADEVTLIEMTAGYGVLARKGTLMSPSLIEEIRTSRGELLYSRPHSQALRVYAETHAETMTAMLARVVMMGTGLNARVADWEVAGKTGTSQGSRDAWFFGYTTRFVAGVWVGNDADRPMADVTGGGAPAHIFSRVMSSALEGMSSEPFPHVRTAELMPPATGDTASRRGPDRHEEIPEIEQQR